MLVIDEDMLKLVKMQERLVRATSANRISNLDSYKKTVIQIDSEAFASLLEQVKHLGEHNRTLEEELPFLEEIKSAYDQLHELQLGYISVCELYGANDLRLSDLSQINIEYINNRISVINGYLLNLRNIEINKNRIQELDKQLADEEKKKDYLGSKLEQLELSLRESFLSAEGRNLVDGSLQYTSVVDEYKKLGIDFTLVLNDVNVLKKMLFEINKERTEVSEKFRTAEICYNNFPNGESKQILDEIKVDFLRIKYRFAMLKILELLSATYNNYDEFKDKREKLLDLIKYRLSCLEDLGIKVSIDPFSRTKVSQQLEELKPLIDNSKVINKIKKELSQLTDRTEEMINQNSGYLISLSETKQLLISKVGMNSIDISSVELLHSDELVDGVSEAKKVVDDNQVVDLRTPGQLNMSIIRQKTLGVIKRVNQMINDTSLHTSLDDRAEVNVSPELVIVQSGSREENKTMVETPNIEYDDIFINYVPDDTPVVASNVDSDDDQLVPDNDEINNIFETVVPFEEPVMFEERNDETLELGGSEKEDTDDSPDFSFASELTSQEDEVDEMPDAFWVTEDTFEEDVLEEDDVISFDDQINILLADQKDVKTKKLEADKSVRKVA